MSEPDLPSPTSLGIEPALPMGTDSIWLGLAILAVCILFVAFFSSSEASLLYVSKIRIRYLAERGSKGAQAVQRVLSKHDKLFATILFTENAFIILASSIGTALALSIVGNEGIYIATISMTILIVLFGEITPKTFAALNAERVSLFASRPIELIIKLVSPAIWFLTALANLFIGFARGHPKAKPPFVTVEELRMQISIAQQEGVVAELEKELLHNVFEFGHSLVREVMVPRPEVVGISESATIDEFLSVFSRSHFSRFPVYKDSLDDIVGIVLIKDVLQGLADRSLQLKMGLSALVRPVPFVPETKRTGELFYEMQASKTQVAIVIDEYGGTAGMVTIEDLVEEIVGEICDETTVEEHHVQRVDDGTLVIDGQTRIDELAELAGISLPEGDYDTVAGYVLGRLGHIPDVGEQVVFDGLTMTVSEMDGLRISQVKVEQIKSQTTLLSTLHHGSA